jgi:eukaryotic-like serine/threonine-protein kinase
MGIYAEKCELIAESHAAAPHAAESRVRPPMDSTNPSASVSIAKESQLEAGHRVGEYEIEAKIGEGGFGSVFRAVHPVIGKVVAIKVLHRRYSAQPEMVRRFVAEARAVNQIRHRNIIDIFAFGQLEDGRHYYVMEYLEGSTLEEHITQGGPMGLADCIPILRRLARALDAAHAKGIAHRDLKPDNVFMAVDEEGGSQPKLLDFGIAKLLSEEAPEKFKTRTGAPIGTPQYMSPEQCRGRGVDHRTDIYGFGIMAYRMLTGVLPFDGEDYMEILLAHLQQPAACRGRGDPVDAAEGSGRAAAQSVDRGEQPRSGCPGSRDPAAARVPRGPAAPDRDQPGRGAGYAARGRLDDRELR